MAGEAVLAFWGVSILFVITPGADWAYAIAAGLRNASPVPAIVGMLLGHLGATVVVAAGVGALVSSVPVVLTVLTVAGALYLGWLGVGLLRRPAVPQVGQEPVGGSIARQVGKGVGVSALNPKVFLLFLALLPQFANPDAAWPVGVQMGVLGLVHVASCGVLYLLVGFGARRVLRTRPAAARIVTRVSGVIMVALGVFLIVEQLIR